MKFLVLMAEDDHFARWEAAERDLRERVYADFRAFSAEVAKRGRILGGEALDAPAAARTVAAGLPRTSTLGPYAETVEQLGGFYLVEVPSREDAVELAGLLPREYTVEVRETLDVVTGNREAGLSPSRFLLLLAVGKEHLDRWEAASGDEQESALVDLRAFAREVGQRGAILAGGALMRPSAARTLLPGLPRASRSGAIAENVEQLAGFYLIATDGFDEAVRLAGLLPSHYAVEVRPTLDVVAA